MENPQAQMDYLLNCKTFFWNNIRDLLLDSFSYSYYKKNMYI